jgi:hypothetical protein
VSYVLKIPDLHIPKLEVENGFQLVAQNFPKSTYLGKNVSLSVDYDGGSYLTISRDTCNIDYPLSIKISQPATPEPPHLALLEEIGQTLKRLDFSMKKTKDVSTREKWRVQNGFVNDMVKGYYLDHIIQHCPNLKHLQLNYAMIFHCNSLANTIWNIKYLCLQRCFVKLEIFRKISSQIPTLDVLSLKYCHVATDENPLKEEESLYSLNMPYTSIGSLALYIARRNHMERAVALTVVNTTTGTTKYYIELGNRRGSINNQTDLGVSAASFSWFQRETVGLSLHVRCAGVALIYC